MKRGNKDGILVIRLSAMGDVALTVPVLIALSRTYPELRIGFLTKDHFTPILEGIPNVKTYPFYANGNHRGIIGLRKLYNELKREPFTCIADLHAVLRTRILRLFFTGSGKPFCILDKGRKEKRELTSWKNKTFQPLKHTTIRYAEVFEDLGYPVQLSENDILPRKQWPNHFQKESDIGTEFQIGVAPFAAHQGKCYPEEEMKQVLAKLGKHPDVRVYLLGGGKKEVDLLDLWEALYPNCISVAGKMSLSEELALISNLDLMVSMDSGNGHLAAIYGVEVITIWGVTHPYAGFSPFNQSEHNSITADRGAYPLVPTSVYGNRVPEGYTEVMKTISPEQVYNRILEVLEGSSIKKNS